MARFTQSGASPWKTHDSLLLPPRKTHLTMPCLPLDLQVQKHPCQGRGARGVHREEVEARETLCLPVGRTPCRDHKNEGVPVRKAATGAGKAFRKALESRQRDTGRVHPVPHTPSAPPASRAPFPRSPGSDLGEDQPGMNELEHGQTNKQNEKARPVPFHEQSEQAPTLVHSFPDLLIALLLPR